VPTDRDVGIPSTFANRCGSFCGRRRLVVAAVAWRRSADDDDDDDDDDNDNDDANNDDGGGMIVVVADQVGGSLIRTLCKRIIMLFHCRFTLSLEQDQ